MYPPSCLFSRPPPPPVPFPIPSLARLQVELRARDDQLSQLRGWLDEAQEELLNTQVGSPVHLWPIVAAALC